MDNVVLDGGPGQGYRSLISGGDNNNSQQLEDLKLSSHHHLKESTSKVRELSSDTNTAQDREFPRQTSIRRRQGGIQRLAPKE